MRKKCNQRFNFLFFAFLLLPLLGLSLTVQAQKREHLTEAEIEIVRDTQELDKRTKVFIKAIERRFQALGNGAATDSKQPKKEKNNSDWGEPPTGTRAQLLGDIPKILEEAMNNIDEVCRRKDKTSIVGDSLKSLSEAAARFQTQLKQMKGKSESEAERDAIYQTNRDLENIIDAQKNFSSDSCS